MDKRGSVPMFVCALIPAIAFMGAFTVRAANNWVVQARLQSALDAGALAAARDINRLQHGTAAEKQAALDRIKALVAGIYNDSSGNSTTLSASNVSVSVNGDKVNLSGSVDTTKPATGGSMTIVKTSGATRSNSGLEMALVFDITLSMTATDAGGGKTRIDAARDAARLLLEILYDDLPKNKDGTPNADNKKYLENLFISVVPFATAVNYGKQNEEAFLGATRTGEVYGRSWSGTDTNWGGCVEMRDISLLDAAPTGGARLNRFFAPSSYDATKKYVAGRPTNDTNFACRLEAAYQDAWYLADTKRRTPASYHNVCMGHNDWTAPEAVFSQKQNTLLKRMVNWSSHVSAGIDPWAVAHGPNMMCPTESTHRVLPLTRDRATVEARIANMTLKKLPFSAGTNIAPGLQAGWFTLSQHWRKQDVVGGFPGWKSEEPVTTTDTRPDLPALPLDYHLPNRQKVLILLTDGDNDWFSARDFQTDDSGTSNVNESLQLVRPESVSSRPEGFYGSYGYIRDQLGATTLSAAETAINARTLELCQKIRTRKPKVKATDPEGPEQITVYTIRFGPSEGSTAAVQMMTNCASKNSKGEALYYHAPNETKLREVFTAIGGELSKLRLSQ
ncbi:hypothetical protein GCM10009416_40050 [Craurococcus roseus]|uniref:Putative Flp pilus-assembly TadG-like N-terminal domain-containing protein n=1 Tax=Craurococcus roseus TaxID=77585 RepID=A0ABN1FU01_9PROT